MKAIFRCDSSRIIGSGHAIRCRTLARRLQKLGVEIVFVCRDHSGNINHLISNEFTLYILDRTKQDNKINDKNKREEIPYREWMACSQEEDAVETYSVIQHLNLGDLDWIIVDHYGIDIVWEQKIHNMFIDSKPKICVIDDLRNREHNAAIVVDQSYLGSSDNDPYKELTPHNCLKLLGPSYALLDEEFSKQRQIKRNSTNIKRILIYFGSVDKFRLVNRVLSILSTSKYKEIKVDVILPSSNENFEEVSLLCKARDNTYLHETLPNLAKLMNKADLCIGAIGATTWERICLGVPTIAISVASNQEMMANQLNCLGYIHLIGNAYNTSIEEISNKLVSYLDKPFSIKTFPRLTDGMGTCVLHTPSQNKR